MNCVLHFLKHYKILIELALTVITTIISLYALLQNKKLARRQIEQEERLANRQNELQERQIKVSLYDQKDKINRALTEAFDITGEISTILNVVDITAFEERDIYNFMHALSLLIKDVNRDEILYKLGQARYFFSEETAKNVEEIRTSFFKIATLIDVFDVMKEQKPKPQLELNFAKEIKTASQKIEELKTTVQTLMGKELQL